MTHAKRAAICYPIYLSPGTYFGIVLKVRLGNCGSKIGKQLKYQLSLFF